MPGWHRVAHLMDGKSAGIPLWVFRTAINNLRGQLINLLPDALNGIRGAIQFAKIAQVPIFFH
jgi:hypothetical protein